MREVIKNDVVCYDFVADLEDVDENVQVWNFFVNFFGSLTLAGFSTLKVVKKYVQVY